MEEKGVLSNIKFIFLAVALFVLIFSAVVVTVLNMYKPVYKVSLGETFLGYYKNQNEFEEVYNTLTNDEKAKNSSVKVYLNEEPNFEKAYIKNSVLENQNIYVALRDNLQKEYTSYNVVIQGKNKMTFDNKDEATKYVADLKKEVPKVACSVVPEKTKEYKEPTSLDVANNIFKDVVSRNKPVIRRKPKYNYGYTMIKNGASQEVAAVAAAQGGVWPTTARYISSHYGYRWGSIHTGIDIAGRGGDPIFAYKDGVVIFSGWGGLYGYMVKIDHGNGIQTWYAHSRKLLVKAGDVVKMGQVIAEEGTTGNSTGNHVHFEIRINGRHVNPYPYIRGK